MVVDTNQEYYQIQLYLGNYAVAILFYSIIFYFFAGYSFV